MRHPAPTLSTLLFCGLLVSALLALASAPAAQEVTLPLDRYEALRERAHPGAEPSPEPPVPLAFEQAFLRIAPGEASARAELELTVGLYGEGWRRLPLPALGSLVAADLGGLEGRLEAEPELALVLRGEGRHRLRLEAVLPLEVDEGATRTTRRLRLSLPAAAITHGVVELAAGQADVEEVRLEGEGVLAAEAGSHSFVAAPGGELTLSFLGPPRAPERDLQPLRFETVSAIRLEAGRDRREARVWWRLRVLQGRLERLTAAVPAPFEVVEVSGEAIAGWDVVEGELEILTLEPVTGELELEIGLLAEPAERFAVLAMAPAEGVRVLEALEVAAGGDGLLELLDRGGVRGLEAAEAERLPAGFRAAAARAFAVAPAEPRPRFGVTWAEATRVLAAEVDHLWIDVLTGEDGRAAYRLWARVRSAGAATLSLELPEGSQLSEARRDGLDVAPGLRGRAWELPLAAAGGPQVLYVSALVPLELPARGELVLPLPTLSAPVARIEVRALLPPGRRGRLAEPTAAGTLSDPPASGGRARPFEAPPGFEPLEAAWSAFHPAPGPLRLHVETERREKEWL